jgi:hypothetical protein
MSNSERDPRVEALARHLARVAGWTGPGNDENTPVTKNLQEQVVAPGGVYTVPRGAFPVWQAYTDMAEAALEWMDAIEPEGEFRRGVAA